MRTDYVLTTPGEVLAQLFQLPAGPALAPRYNIAPTQTVPIVRVAEAGARELALVHWGLIPHWAKERGIGSRMINARAETLAEKPAFRDAFRKRRCLIPASGFFEWKKEGKATSEGGTAAIEALAALGIELGNQAFANSDVGTQFRLVRTAELAYQETGNMSETLSRLTTPGDGYLDEAQALRDQVQADLVVLLTSETTYCGIAWVMTTESPGFSSYAYSVTSTSCVTNHTLGHEVGHNLGCAHDRASGGSGVTPYSFGYRYCNDSVNGYRTVMAYPCSYAPRVPYFSNRDPSAGTATSRNASELSNIFRVDTFLAEIIRRRCTGLELATPSI